MTQTHESDRQNSCPDCGQPKDTPITWTYCRRCTDKRIREA